MYPRIILTVAIVLFAAGLMTAGCSTSAIEPIPESNDIRTALPDDGSSGTHCLLGIWDVVFDPDTLAVGIEPVRGIEAHYNVTPMLLPPNCNDCVKIIVNSFSPITGILDATVWLTNPTALHAYDVRGIFYTNHF